jgi:hypothetical protein
MPSEIDRVQRFDTFEFRCCQDRADCLLGM